MRWWRFLLSRADKSQSSLKYNKKRNYFGQSQRMDTNCAIYHVKASGKRAGGCSNKKIHVSQMENDMALRTAAWRNFVPPRCAARVFLLLLLLFSHFSRARRNRENAKRLLPRMNYFWIIFSPRARPTDTHSRASDLSIAHKKLSELLVICFLGSRRRARVNSI